MKTERQTAQTKKRLERRLAENRRTIAMDPSEVILAAYVKFRPIRECNIQIGPYVRCLVRSHWSAVASGTHDNCSMTLLVDLCQHIVNLSSMTILEAIRPVISDWHRKAPRIYTCVNPEQCLFGINESDVLANLKIILPQCFYSALNTSQCIHCESLDKFIELVATEVTRRVNSRIAVVMGTSILPGSPLAFECNCICFTTLNTMIGLVSQILRCMHQLKCQCTPVSRNSARASTTVALQSNKAMEKPVHMVIEQGPCDIMYCTENKKAIEILTEITKFWRKNVEDESAGHWCEDCDSWSSECSDITYSSNGYADSEGSYDDSVQTSFEELQSSDHTDTQDRSEDLISQASDTEPGCPNKVASQPVSPASPCEDQPEDSAAVPAVSSDMCSSESETLPHDDTKHRLVILLLAGFLLHTQKKARASLCQADFNRVIKNLRDKALGEIKFADIVISSNCQTVKKIYKALFGDLRRHYGSATVLLKTMASQDSAADDLVIQALKTHLTTPAPTPKKNAVVRFFSSVGKAIVKPFNGCFSSSSSS